MASLKIAPILKTAAFKASDVPKILVLAERQQFKSDIASKIKSLIPGSIDAGATTAALKALADEDSKLQHVSLFGSEARSITYAAIAHKRSRNAPIIRVDAVKDAVSEHANKTHSTVILSVLERAEQALPTATAISRAFPLFSRKTAKKPDMGQTIYVDFLAMDGKEIDYEDIAISVNATRTAQELVDTPPADFHVPEMIARAKNLAKNLPGVSVEVIEGQELKKGGFGGIWGVGKGAVYPPAIVVLSSKPSGATKTYAMVGKGIVYDSGGLSLKSTEHMCSMKSDMGGSAAVVAAFEALVRSKCPHNVHAVLCMAENAIGPQSYRNDDILTMYSGKTVEINNTDAEGRLALADGVAYASKHLNPDVVFTIATLTGAQALVGGSRFAAILCSDEQLENTAVRVGKTIGEPVYPTLYDPEYLNPLFDSTVADMRNSVKERMSPQTAAAGHFIESHLSDAYKGAFCHFDIAGPSFVERRATGFGASLLYKLLGEVGKA